jgi:hypothetical protein
MLDKRSAIDNHEQSLFNRQTHVGIAFWTNKETTFRFLTKEDFLAARTLHPYCVGFLLRPPPFSRGHRIILLTAFSRR